MPDNKRLIDLSPGWLPMAFGLLWMSKGRFVIEHSLMFSAWQIGHLRIHIPTPWGLRILIASLAGKEKRDA